jgi:membrane-associated phospholipid phosphatase
MAKHANSKKSKTSKFSINHNAKIIKSRDAKHSSNSKAHSKGSKDLAYSFDYNDEMRRSQRDGSRRSNRSHRSHRSRRSQSENSNESNSDNNSNDNGFNRRRRDRNCNNGCDRSRQWLRNDNELNDDDNFRRLFRSGRAASRESRSASSRNWNERIACRECVPSHHYNNNILPNNPYALYSKALPHDADGYVNKFVYIQFYKALKNQSIDQLNYVPLGGATKLLDPPAAWSRDVPAFVRSSQFCLPKLSTALFAANIAEVYIAAAARDVVFSDYTIDVQIAKSVVDFANLSCYRGPAITNLSIFRGESAGDLIGPYISQLLLLDYEQAGIIYNQQYPMLAAVDYMTTLFNTLSVQNGIVNEVLAPLSSARYISTGRDLASYFRGHTLILPYVRAVGVLFNAEAPFNAGIPVNSSFTGFSNFGRPDIEACLGAVSRLAALAAFCQKVKALYIRPEEVGILINRVRLGLNLCHNPTLSDEILDSAILGDIFNAYGNYLLPQAYPEGSPASPSYPSVHAVVAGACITVLKFFFNGQWNLNLMEPDIGATSLISTGLMSNLSNELDKLASNVGMARIFAGVNYRMDIIGGIRLGEQVALRFLREHVEKYPQCVNIQITLYNGDIVYINN